MPPNNSRNGDTGLLNIPFKHLVQIIDLLANPFSGGQGDFLRLPLLEFLDFASECIPSAFCVSKCSSDTLTTWSRTHRHYARHLQPCPAVDAEGSGTQARRAVREG